VNVRYLTGFESSSAFVLVKHKRVLLLTDGRFIEAARAVGGVEVVQLEREPVGVVIVRNGGAEVLTPFTKDLLTLD
jgi:hypothetical protein